MSGKACLSQQLKALPLNLSIIHCLMRGRFSTVGAQGRIGWSVGGRVLLGQLQGVSPGVTTPELEHFGRTKTSQ